MTGSINRKRTGLRQMNSRGTWSCRWSRHIRLERRFSNVDVVDVVLGACGTQLAATASDAVLQPADAGDDDDDEGGSNDDHDW